MAIEIRRVSDGRAEVGLGGELRHGGSLEHRVHAGVLGAVARGGVHMVFGSLFPDLPLSLFFLWAGLAESRPFGRKKLELR